MLGYRMRLRLSDRAMAAPRRMILRTMDGITGREDMALDIAAAGAKEREVEVTTAGEVAVVMGALLNTGSCWWVRCEHRRIWPCACAGIELDVL